MITSAGSGGPRPRGALASAFTIVELIAVMVILAVISAVAIPLLTTSAAPRASAVTARLGRDLQFARQKAVARGLRTWVVFDLSDQSYSMFIEDQDKPGRGDRQPMFDEITGRPIVVALGSGATRGVHLDGVNVDGRAEIGFDTRGRPLADDESLLMQDATITISGDHILVVRARTGDIRTQ